MGEKRATKTTYLIDDRPGEEMVVTANTSFLVTLLKGKFPHLREVTADEYYELEWRLEEQPDD